MKYACEWRQMVCHSPWISDGHFNPSIFEKIFFWGVDHFQSLSWMCCNIASVYGLVSGLWAMWDLSPLTGERTCSPGLGWWSLPHWSSGEVPSHPFLSAPSCTDIPNILRLCVFLMPPPPAPMLTKMASYFHLSVLMSISLGRAGGLNEDYTAVS